MIWMAELALDGYRDLGQPTALFEHAKQLPLSESSLHYVNAMLADNSPEALACFQKTLDIDPFHHRARRMLITMLLSLGRIEAANTEIDLASELFPEDIDFKIFKALVHAHRGDVAQGRDIIDQLSIDPEAKAGWSEFCNLMDKIANRLVLHPGAMRYDEREIHAIASEFTSQLLPLIEARGWHFPPKIGPELAPVPRLITASITMENSEEIVNQWRRLTKAHPEGSLLSLFGERLIAVQNLTRDVNRQGFDSVNDDIIRESVIALEESSKQPALAKSVHRTNWIGLYANATALALIYKVDVEENKKRMLRAATKIAPRDVANVAGLRGLAVGLLNTGQPREAESFALEWVRRTQGKQFDAVWHQLMCDRYQEKWFEVATKCNSLVARFPDKPNLLGLRNAAVKHLKEAVESQGSSQQDLAEMK